MSDDTERGPAQPASATPNGWDILEGLAKLPISEWRYTSDDREVRHLGPMAQDFAAAFGLGDSDRKIDHVDANGVALVAIQALYRRVLELEAQISELRAQQAMPD